MKKTRIVLIPLLLALVSVPVFAGGTYGSNDITASETDGTVYYCEAYPVSSESDFSFEDGQQYIIVSVGSNPYTFAMSSNQKNNTESNMYMLAGQVTYDSDTGILALEDQSEDISDYIWVADNSSGASAYLQSLSKGQYFTFGSQPYIFLGNIGTAVKTGEDGRIWIGYYSSDYYLTCVYYQYATPADYYFGRDISSSSTGAAGMPMLIYKVKTCEHPEESTQFVKTVAPSCTEEGYDEYLCNVCGNTFKTNTVAAAGHSYSGGICSVCGIKQQWDGVSAREWTKGSGSRSDPYLLEEEANLAWLAEKVNLGEKYSGEYFRLTCNMDMGNHPWMGIGNNVAAGATTFSGHFLGDGHTISNVSITYDAKYGSFFAYISGTSSTNRAEVRDLVIKGSNTSGRTDASGLSAYASNCDIINVGIEMDITERYNGGGFIGHSLQTVNITGCYYKGNITATENSTSSGYGAAAFAATSSGTLTIEDSYNLGDITAPSGCLSIGGLVGTASGTVNLKNVYNYGYMSGGRYSGALIGNGSLASAEATYYLYGCADNVSGSGGTTGNAAYYTSNKTLLKNLSSSFIDGSSINSDYSGSPALYWESEHEHVVSGISDDSWIWSDDYSECSVIYVCTASGCYGSENEDGTHTLSAAADVTSTLVKDASCTEEGSREHTAELTIGGTTYSDTVTEVIPATGHRMVKVAKVSATCEKTGNIEYYRCGTCKNLYADENGDTQIDKDDTVIPVAEHTIEEVQAKEPSCNEPGNTAYFRCPVCQKLFSDPDASESISPADTVIPAKGHELTYYEAVSPDYRAEGNTEYYYCSACGKYFSDADSADEIAEGSWILPKLTTRYISGDVNRDGYVDIRDAACFKRYLAGKMDHLDDEQIYLADINDDGAGNALDAALIIKYSVSGSIE